MRTSAMGPGSTIIRLVALVASASLASCTYNFDKFTEARDAAVETGGSSGGATLGTGGAAGETSATGGAAGAPPMTGGAAGWTGGTIDPGGTGGMGTGGVRGDSGGTSGRGTGGMGTGGASIDAGGGPAPDPDLVLWYTFDESSGTTAADSAMFGGTARNASLATMGTGGSAAFSTAKQVGTHAVTLAPATTAPVLNGGYVTVPALQPLAPGALTIAVWVNLAAATTAQDWERVFDFGTTSTANNFLYLVARAGSPNTNPVQFVISTKGHSAASGQTINSPSALTPNVWHHLAIVLPAGATYTGTLYIDGKAVATNPAMTLHASDIGATTNNFLGRSQFSGKSSGDPLFNGSLDDFRVYRRALSQQEIADLVAIR